VELECEFRICSSLHTARDALVGRVRSTRSPKAMRGVWGQVGKQSPGRRARSWQRHAVAEVVLPQLTKIQQVDGEGYLNKKIY